MNVLVIAEHSHQELNPSTLSTITAGKQLGNVHVLVAGENCGAASQAAASVEGVDSVLQADAAHYAHHLAEELAPLVVELASNYDYVLAPATTFGKNVLPRIAAMLDTSQISDISEIVSADTFIRPIYAGNALATVQSTDDKKLLTIRTVNFEAAANSGGSAEIQALDTLGSSELTTFSKQELMTSERPELATAKVVVSGGRGMGSAENFALIEQLADKLGAAVGASRAAVDSGYISNDKQVGQTGVVVAPQLYIAVGISGAVQHLAGMKDSKVIVAINKDPEAPIFTVADYGLVADLFDVVPELTSAL
ncbi:MAG: electron transfer flavoprotein subunit alpha/FixB family protein [Arenicella sp.]